VQNRERKSRPVSQRSSLVYIRSTKQRNGYIKRIELIKNLLFKYVIIIYHY